MNDHTHIPETIMNETTFRQLLLAAIAEVQVRQPGMQLHLLYAPELADPLELVQDDRRAFALLRRPLMTALPDARAARVITLDCRRVASYLLETHHGIDDPLLESSITQAYAEIYLEAGIQSTLTNDDFGMAESAICGWIISADTAQQIASRINGMSYLGGVGRLPKLVRWYCPESISTLWPTLTSGQKRSLLGDAVWLLPDACGDMQRYVADRPQLSDEPEELHLAHRLSAIQLQRLDNMPVVKVLAGSWAAMCAEEGMPVPLDAHSKLHRHVHAAQEHKLDAENLMLYVMTAVQLPVVAMQSPEFIHMLRQVANDGMPLREGLQRLPDQFWERYETDNDASPVLRTK